MYAADFRAAARRALAGRWGLAVVAGLIARLLGAGSSGVPEIKFQFQMTETGANLTLTPSVSLLPDLPPVLQAWVAGRLVLLILCALAVALLFFTVGSVVALGYARFNLALADGEEPRLALLVDYFPWFKTALCARLLAAGIILLWSLLLIVPGIMAAYGCAMTPYILAEHPELTAGEAVQRSRDLMYGRRWRLFCLQMSFLGWALLSALIFGLGALFITPYAQTATALFYRDITRSSQAFPSL